MVASDLHAVRRMTTEVRAALGDLVAAAPRCQAHAGHVEAGCLACEVEEKVTLADAAFGEFAEALDALITRLPSR